MGEVFEIGYFQLENLTLNHVIFVFFDLRTEKVPVKDEPLKSMMKTALPVESAEVSGYLREKTFDKKTPIVLMCTDGRSSQKLAIALGREGYINVNVIENGFLGLLEEAQSLTHS